MAERKSTARSGKKATPRQRAKARSTTMSKEGVNKVSRQSQPRIAISSSQPSQTQPMQIKETSLDSFALDPKRFINATSDSVAMNVSPSVEATPVKEPPLYFRILGALIGAAMIFTLGVTVGERRTSSIVDNAIDTLVSNRPDQVNRGILERAAIEAMLKASGDSWANYFPKSALTVLNEANTNSYSGIGATLRKSRSGAIEISGITPKSPAALAGLTVGDQVLEINGTDIQGASLTSAIAILRGSVSSKIDLLILRENKKLLISISPAKLTVTNVEATQVATNVGLISISSFSKGTAAEVQRSLERLKIKEGLIIDLRNNPGGLIDEAVGVAQLFIGNGTIVSYRVNGSEKVFTANNRIPITVPIVAMINKSTASAAEILASSLQDRNRGVVIGERSYGKGSVQEFRTLEDGSKLELTVALYLTPSGRTIEGVGVTPDLEVKPEELGTKALQILGGLASLGTSK